MRRGIGILIDCHVHPARPRLVDQPQRFRTSPPVSGSNDLVVCYLRRKPAFFADPDRLTHTVENSRRFIPHMRDVHSAERAHNFGNLDYLLGRRVVSGHVEQPCREAESETVRIQDSGEMAAGDSVF